MKKTLKTLICVLALSISLFSLVGCEKKDTVSKETNNSTQQSDVVTQSNNEPDSSKTSVFDEYDNLIVQGNEATGCIESYASVTFPIIVITNANPLGEKYTKRDSYDIENKNDKNFIDTSADFKSTTGRSKGGSVISLTFTQIKNETNSKSKSAPDSRMNVIFDNYDNVIVQGNEATGCIESYASEDIAIIVITKANVNASNTSGTLYTVRDSYSIEDENDEDFIDTSADFRSTVVRANNGAITSVTFTQL